MKVSIDSILGSARKVTAQRQPEEENLENKKKEIKTDSVTIGVRVDSRLDSIEKEFHDAQTSLTKNQILREGIDQLFNDMKKGGQNLQNILNEVLFEGKNVLRDFVGEKFDSDMLTIKKDRSGEAIQRDVERIKRLQVELDNIMASDVASAGKIEKVMRNTDALFAGADIGNIESISRLRADSVMKLIK